MVSRWNENLCCSPQVRYTTPLTTVSEGSRPLSGKTTQIRGH